MYNTISTYEAEKIFVTAIELLNCTSINSKEARKLSKELKSYRSRFLYDYYPYRNRVGKINLNDPENNENLLFTTLFEICFLLNAIRNGLLLVRRDILEFSEVERLISEFQSYANSSLKTVDYETLKNVFLEYYDYSEEEFERFIHEENDIRNYIYFLNMKISLEKDGNFQLIPLLGDNISLSDDALCIKYISRNAEALQQEDCSRIYRVVKKLKLADARGEEIDLELVQHLMALGNHFMLNSLIGLFNPETKEILIESIRNNEVDFLLDTELLKAFRDVLYLYRKHQFNIG